MKRKQAEYIVFQNAGEMWKFMAQKWKEISSDAVRDRKLFSTALSGGKTPAGFYQYLASVEGLPWNKTYIFFADERFVPATDEASNYKMVRENLMEGISLPSRNIHPINTAHSSPQLSAIKYEEKMKNFFELEEGGLPEFDLILLGVGEDGHTASLFPGSKVLKDKSHLAAAVTEAPLHKRITLTLPVINNARNVFFLVSGKNKSAILKRMIDGKDSALPAFMVQPSKGRLFFIMDKEARGKP